MSEPIHKRVIALGNRLDSQASRAELASTLKSLMHADTRVQEHAQEFDQAFSRARTLISAGILQNENTLETDELSTQSKRIRTCLEDSKPLTQDSEGNPGPLEPLLTELKNLKNSIDEKTNKAWNNHCAQEITEYSEQLLTFFQNKKMAVVNKIRTLQTQLNEHRETVPRSDADIQDFNTALKTIREQWEQCDIGDKKTQKFIEAVIDGGASIDLLTDDVRKTLKEKDLLHAFKIKT